MIVKKDSADYNNMLKGEKCVFINGVFDVFHLEHLRMINFARYQFPGHKLIMAINSDTSVKNMGKSHPLIFNEEYRSEFLNELADVVVIYDGFYDYLDIIKTFKPDFIIKGSEYQYKNIPEKKLGINVIYYFGEEGISSTEVYNRIIKKFNEATQI